MVAEPVKISLETARKLVLHLQGLTHPPHKAQSLDDLRHLIRQLGLVQVDSIQWVERAHHMILFARNQTYRPKHLKRLAERERAVFENWTHDASFIPIEFYPWWQHRFRRIDGPLKERMVRWQGSGFLDHVNQLYSHITEHGAVRSRDLEKPERNRPAEMWQWHDGKAALEYLWRTGKLAISGRESGFQKVYDLTERCIPPEHLADLATTNQHNHEAFVDWACRSALERLGFGTPKDISHYWELLTLGEVKDWCDRQSDLVTVEAATVRKGETRSLLALPQTIALVDSLPDPPGRIRVLSPFDPVIRDRKRLEWLFGFDFRIEIYVPESKRKYGYYVFPLLEGSKLVGRIDMKAERKTSELVVRRLWLEKGVRWSTAKRERLQSELQRLCRLCSVSKVRWLETEPATNPG